MKRKSTPTTKDRHKSSKLQPKVSTVCNLLVFAAAYPVEKITSSGVCDLLIN